MFPNPATDELHIINKKVITKIDVLNITGQLQFSVNQSVIDISNLAAGVYVIKAFGENSIAVQKFIKQ